MSWFTKRMLTAALLIAFGMFLGINWMNAGKSGGEATYTQNQAAVPVFAQTNIHSPVKPVYQTVKSSMPMKIVSDSKINHAGNKLGDLLQILAYHSIKGTVSVLNSIF